MSIMKKIICVSISAYLMFYLNRMNLYLSDGDQVIYPKNFKCPTPYFTVLSPTVMPFVNDFFWTRPSKT